MFHSCNNKRVTDIAWKSDSNDFLSPMIDRKMLYFYIDAIYFHVKIHRVKLIYIMKVEKDAFLMKSQRRKLIKVTWKRHTSLLITIFKLR